MKKQTCFHLLFPIFLILLLLISIPVSAADTSGTLSTGQCGQNATWSYENGTLTVSGSGNVDNVLWSHHAQNIHTVVIEDGITNVPGWAFTGCSNLKTVTLADSIATIGQSAFERCTGLTSIALPKNLESIEQSAFSNCSSLNKITMDNKVTTLGTFAFSGTAITGITLSDSLTTMGDSVFNGCKQLKELHFPASLKKMGDYIITGCSALKYVYFYGDLPETTGMNYNNTYAVVYYPKDNDTWSSENLPSLSGGFILKPYTVCSIDGHTYGGWINIEEPTAEKEGRKQRICGVCKHIDYAPVPKLESDSSVTNSSTPPATEPPVTQPPVTQPPVTQPPVTQPPVTQPPVTQPPVTQPSTAPATEPTSTPATEPLETNPSPTEQVPSQPVVNEPTPKKNYTGLIIGISLSVALLGGGIAWYLLRKRK